MTWGNLITGLLVEGLSRMAQPQATGGVESLLAELGWAIDERQGDAAVLHFESPEGTRKLSVRTGDDGFTVFATASFAAFRSVPSEVAQ
jgi:hypothetical protein